MRPSRAALWRVIYIARDEKQAGQIEDLLREAGFMANRRATSGGEDIEIRALDSEAEEARLYLLEQGY